MASLTGSLTPARRREVYAEVASGALHMVIGTHALAEEALAFKELGLVDNATLFPGGRDPQSWKVAGWRLNGMIRALAREARSQKTPEIENIHPLTFGMNELQQAG